MKDNNLNNNKFENDNPNVKVINTNGANKNASFNSGDFSNGEQMNYANSEEKDKVSTPAGRAYASASEYKKETRIQEVITYIIMIIIIIIIILLLLKFCSENGGKSIYKPRTTQNKTTTTTKKVITETTTKITPGGVIVEPTTEITGPTVIVDIPGNSTKKTRQTTTKSSGNPQNPGNPGNPQNPGDPQDPDNPSTSSKTTTTTKKTTTTTTTTKAAVYTYTFSKPTSETFAVNIFKDGQILSGSVYIWSMDGELLSVGVVGQNAVVTITTAFADLSTHPKLKFSFQSDPKKYYTMTYHS